MIFSISQVRTNFDMVWIADCKGKCVCVAKAPFEKGAFNIYLEYPDQEDQHLYYNPDDLRFGDSLLEKHSFKLFMKGQLQGKIMTQNKRMKGFLQSYAYTFLTIGGTTYYLYEVGFGKKGLYLCIYEEEKLIAIVDKELTVRNFQDEYMVYSSSHQYSSVIVPLVLYYDMRSYADLMDVKLSSVKHDRVNTIQKELISEFDPEFIPRIKEMDN